MTTASIITIVCAMLGSAGLFSLIQFFINRKDKKDDEIKQLKEELRSIIKNQKEIKQDATRTQLLILMAHFPNEEHRILLTAQKYFVDQEGDWWMSSKFTEFCDEHNITKPDWYKPD